MAMAGTCGEARGERTQQHAGRRRSETMTRSVAETMATEEKGEG